MPDKDQPWPEGTPLIFRSTAEFRCLDGTAIELGSGKVEGFNFAADDRGNLRLVILQTYDLVLAGRFKEKMFGTMHQHLGDSRTGEVTVWDTPGYLKVVSVLPSKTSSTSSVLASIYLVPCDARGTSQI